MSTNAKEIDQLVNQTYEAGFYTDIEQEFAPPGLNEETIRFISKKKAEVSTIFPFIRTKALEVSDILLDFTNSITIPNS